jgi:hypothetical protein
MRATRLAVVLAATVVAVLAVSTQAHAGTITQSFHADSGDSCRYGVTDGTLGWRTGTSPLPFIAVDVRGTLTDRPSPSDPSTACRDDGFYSTATFVAYSRTVAIDRQSRRADNAVVSFAFTLGSSSTTSRVDRVVIQVCRSPVNTLPPGYCGRPAEYLAPPIG